MDSLINKKVSFQDLGLRPFDECWDIQTSLFESILEQKKQNRDHPKSPTNNYLLFVEHPHVFTLGKNGTADNLLIDLNDLSSINASYFPINRGGDITYHGQGQLVAYPVVDLENFKPDLSYFLRAMEEAVILVLKDYGIGSGRIDGLTGVWLEPENEKKARKICAIGIKTSRWVTMHGLAFNINTDLEYFDYIVPCGIEDKGVTSLEKELGKKVPMEEVKESLKEKFELTFGMELIPFNFKTDRPLVRHTAG